MNNKPQRIILIIATMTCQAQAQLAPGDHGLDNRGYTYLPFLGSSYRQSSSNMARPPTFLQQDSTPIQKAAQRLREISQDNHDEQRDLSNKYARAGQNESSPKTAQ